MTWYQTLVAAHLSVTTDVSHYIRLNSDRYFVWQEDGVHDLFADNRHTARAVTGSTDLFTKEEFDPWAEALEAAFDAHGISWTRSSVQYEEDTGFTHFEWTWEVMGDGQSCAI